MALSEDVPSDAEVGHFDRTIQNAKRLAADSKLLIENGHGLSAVTLMILAIEELVKTLINIWGVRNTHSKREFPSHIEKQSAVLRLVADVQDRDAALWEQRVSSRGGSRRAEPG